MHPITELTVYQGSVVFKWECGQEYEEKVDEANNRLDDCQLRCGCQHKTIEASSTVQFQLGLLLGLLHQDATAREIADGVHIETENAHALCAVQPGGL